MKNINKKLLVSLLSLMMLSACNTPNTLTNNNVNQAAQQSDNKQAQIKQITGNAQISNDSVKFNISLPKKFKIKNDGENTYLKMSLKSSTGEIYYPTEADAKTHLFTLDNLYINKTLEFKNIKYDAHLIGTLEIYTDNVCEGTCEDDFPTLKTIFSMNKSSVDAKINPETTIAALIYEKLKESKVQKENEIAKTIDSNNLQAFINKVIQQDYNKIIFSNNISINNLTDLVINANGNVDANTTVPESKMVLNSFTLDKESYSNSDDAILSLSGFKYDDIDSILFDDKNLTLSEVINNNEQDTSKVKVSLPELNSTNNSLTISLKDESKATIKLDPYKKGIDLKSNNFDKVDKKYYVTVSGSETKSGSDWNNTVTLQYALSKAKSGDTIYVAKGTYHPAKSSDTDSQSASFVISAGVKVYGGFIGDETILDLNDRDLTTNQTILSGDLNDDDLTNGKNDNSYTVVKTSNDNNNKATINGFTISNGNNISNTVGGGGMYNSKSSPVLTNIRFSNNSAASTGGGMYNSTSSSPSLTNVIFSNNSANAGGGMYNFNMSSPILTDVNFYDNSANLGGGMANSSFSSPILTDVNFSNNSAVSSGGGMFNSKSSLSLTNVNFSGNSAQVGKVMFNSNSLPTLNNLTYSNGNSSTDIYPNLN